MFCRFSSIGANCPSRGRSLFQRGRQTVHRAYQRFVTVRVERRSNVMKRDIIVINVWSIATLPSQNVCSEKCLSMNTPVEREREY